MEYIGRRLIALIPVVLGIVTIVFIIMQLIPGDPITMIIGKQSEISEEEIARLRSLYGLDKPVYIQYFYFLVRFIHGDLGKSFVMNQPALEVVLDRLPATVELAIISILLTIIIALPAGIIAALKGGATDQTITSTSVIAFSMPNFWIGMLLILIFGTNLKIFPIGGRLGVQFEIEKITGFYILDALLNGNYDAFISAVRHIILPALSLGIPATALIVRLLRNNLISVLGSEFIRFARAKGVHEKIIIYKHALRNALIPTINIVALQLGFFLTGSFFVEYVFGWPGIGLLAVNSIYNRDYPVVIVAVMVAAFFYVLCNLLADILLMIVDPRTRRE